MLNVLVLLQVQRALRGHGVSLVRHKLDTEAEGQPAGGGCCALWVGDVTCDLLLWVDDVTCDLLLADVAAGVAVQGK